MRDFHPLLTDDCDGPRPGVVNKSGIMDEPTRCPCGHSLALHTDQRCIGNQLQLGCSCSLGKRDARAAAMQPHLSKKGAATGDFAA